MVDFLFSLPGRLYSFQTTWVNGFAIADGARRDGIIWWEEYINDDTVHVFYCDGCRITDWFGCKWTRYDIPHCAFWLFIWMPCGAAWLSAKTRWLFSLTGFYQVRSSSNSSNSSSSNSSSSSGSRCMLSNWPVRRNYPVGMGRECNRENTHGWFIIRSVCG